MIYITPLIFVKEGMENKFNPDLSLGLLFSD